MNSLSFDASTHLAANAALAPPARTRPAVVTPHPAVGDPGSPTLGWPNVRSGRMNPTIYQLLSRMIDIVASSAALFALFPLMAVVALVLRLSDDGPAFYAQRRVGRGGQPFYCLKFRTMVTGADARLAEYLARSPEARAEWNRDHKLRNDPRVTKFGMFLRTSSIDELPQLINVLRGEMALVGPRPIVEAEIVRYGRFFAHYCRVKPGLTGLWQVSGRSTLTYRRRVALDTCYARSQCLWFDVRILLKTVPMVLLARGSC